MQQPYVLAARVARVTRLALAGCFLLVLALLLPWAALFQTSTIGSFGPASGPAGSPVTITGRTLGSVTGCVSARVTSR